MSGENKSSNPVKTVLVITVGFCVLFLLTEKNSMLYTASVVGSLGTLSNFFAEKIDLLWAKLAWVLSKIVPNILLMGVFYFVLTPIAWLSRIFSKSDPIDLKNSNSSFFKEKNQPYSKTSFEKPW